MTLRDEQREATRRRICAAVLELLETEAAATISVPDVAKKSGVSLRTVYRYYPTKGELIDAAGREFGRNYDDLISSRLGYHWSEPGTDFGPFLVARWSEMEADIAAVRAQHNTLDGRDALRARVARWRELTGQWLDGTGDGLDADDRADVIDLLNALASTSLFLELVDRQGHSGAKAAQLANRAREALLASLTDDES